MKLLLILLCKGSGALVVPFQRAGGSVPVMHSVPASLVAEIGRLIFRAFQYEMELDYIAVSSLYLVPVAKGL